MDTDALELLLDMPIKDSRGRKSSAKAYYCRDLNEADLEVVHNPPPQGSRASPMLRLRHTHHMMAKLVAEGRKGVEIAQILGYSQSRISILKNDPAFQELVEYYKGQVDVQYTGVHERLAALGLDTLDELQARLDEQPESFTARELMELSALVLDRSSAPKKVGAGSGGGPAGAVQVLVNFHQPAQSAKLVGEASEGHLLDITPKKGPSDG